MIPLKNEHSPLWGVVQIKSALSILIVFLAASPLRAIEKPALRLNAPSLGQVVLKVNGEERTVRAGEEMALVLGDRFKFEGVWDLHGVKKEVPIEVIGYQLKKSQSDTPVNEGAHAPAEDTSTAPPRDHRSLVIDSMQNLDKKLAHDPKQNIYRIDVGPVGRRLGSVYLRVLEPRLKYAEIEVNGAMVVLRDNELVRLNAADNLIVKRVETNVADSNEQVQFSLIPRGQMPGFSRMKFFEAQFSRHGRVFARVPIQVDDL